jgi:hypothetical protein
MYVYTSFEEMLDVPFTVDTVTFTEPTAPGGAIAVICVVEFTVKPSAGVAPKLTAVTSV